MIDTNEIDRLLDISYADVPGGALIGGKELLRKADNLKISVDTKEPERYHWFVASKETQFGMKLIYCGTDGQPRSKIELTSYIRDVAMKPELRGYAEVSGSLQRLLERAKVPKVPAVDVILVLQKAIKILDTYTYERDIQGIARQKVMFGYPQLVQ